MGCTQATWTQMTCLGCRGAVTAGLSCHSAITNVLSLCAITMCHHQCAITMCYHYVPSPCAITMCHHHVLSLCAITMCHHQCAITMCYHHVPSPCVITKDSANSCSVRRQRIKDSAYGAQHTSESLDNTHSHALLGAHQILVTTAPKRRAGATGVGHVRVLLFVHSRITLS